MAKSEDKIDDKMQKKIIEKIGEMEASLTSSEFKNSLRMLFDLFIEKVKDDKSSAHIETLVKGVVQCVTTIKMEIKLCACMFLYTFLAFLVEKDKDRFRSYNRFLDEVEKEVAPKLYNLFDSLQKEYLTNKLYRDNIDKKQLKHNIFFLVLLAILNVLELCMIKFKTDKNGRTRLFEKFHNELAIDSSIKEMLNGYSNVTFDVFENRLNYFEKLDNENPEEFRQKVKMMLKTIADTREQMKFYLNVEIDSESAKRFDEKMDDYKNEMYDLQDFINPKRKLLDENLKSIVQKEELFTKFLLQDLVNLYMTEDLTITQTTQIISDKYEEIFYSEKDGKANVSHESIKLPEIQKQPFMRTDSELSDFISPNRFKPNPNSKMEQPRAFFGKSDIEPFQVDSKFGFGSFEPDQKNPFEVKELGFDDFSNVPTSFNEKADRIADIFSNTNKTAAQNSNNLSRSLTQIDPENKKSPMKPLQRAETMRQNDKLKVNFDDDLPMSQEPSKDQFDDKDPFMAATRNLNQFSKGPSDKKTGTFGIQSKNSPFAVFDAPDQNLFNPAPVLQKPSITNFEDFDNFNQSSKFKSEDHEALRQPNIIASESQFDSQHQIGFTPRTDFAPAKPANKITDFNSIFLDSSNITMNPRDNFGIRQSTVSIGNNMFKNSKLMNISAIEKHSSSSFFDKKPNTRFQFGASRFSATKNDTMTIPDNRALISDAINKISTTINSKKISQVTIKSSNINSNAPIVSKAPVIESSNSFGNAIPSVSHHKPSTPFMPAYNSSIPRINMPPPSRPSTKNQDIHTSVHINFPEAPNLSSSQIKIPLATGNELKVNQPPSVRVMSEAKNGEVAENNFVFEMDDFNSVHSDKLQTPPEQSIHNYSNMIPANLKMPVRTPSHHNYSQNFGNVVQNDDPGRRRVDFSENKLGLRPKSSDIRKSQDGNQRVARENNAKQNSYLEAREEQDGYNGNPFDAISNIRNTRLQSVETGSITHITTNKREPRPFTASSVGQLEIRNETANNNINNSRTDFSDNFSQFAVDEKITQKKNHLEKNIEIHKRQFQDLGTTNARQNTSSRKEEMADQIAQQYNGLFQKMVADYESLLDNYKSEMKDQKTYIEGLVAQNEKYKYKSFNLENELIGLKEHNVRLNTTLNSLKKKYENGLAKQKEQIKQSSEAKVMALERSYQEKIQTIKSEADKEIVRLKEELNDYGIEISNLRVELDLARGDKLSDTNDLRKRISDLKDNCQWIQRDFETQLKALREYIRTDLTSTDMKRVATLKRARDELLDTLKSEQKKNEELSKQVITLSNECSVLRSNITFNQHGIKTPADKQDIISVKVKTVKLKQMVKEASWIIHVMLNNMRHHLTNIKQLKMQEMTKKMTNFETVTNSQHNELTKLNFQCQNLKEEVSNLKEKYENAVEQNKVLQKQILETRVQPPQNTGVISSDPEFIKKFKQLEYENKSLNDINKQISTELIQCKERIIILQTENSNTEKLYATLKNLELENEELMETNKCLFNELYEAKLNTKGAKAPSSKTKGSFKESDHMRYVNQHMLMRAPMPINANSVTIVNNLPTINQTQYNQNVDNSKHSTVTGTAFIKKFDMFMEILNSQDKSKEKSSSLMEWVSQRPPAEFRGISQQFVKNSYCLVKTPTFKLMVDESIAFKNTTVQIDLRLTFVNLSKSKLNLLNFAIDCNNKFFRSDLTAPLNSELQPFDHMVQNLSIIVEENYMLLMNPIFLSFCLLDQNLYNAYVSGSRDPDLIEQNFHVLALPLSINKLLMTQKEEVAKFGIIKTLQNVGELDIYNCRNVGEDDLCQMFPNLTEISLQDNIYGVKINSLFGTFFVTILIDQKYSVNLKVFAMYQSPLHGLYLQTLKFIFENL
jgi:hypothetical protein